MRNESIPLDLICSNSNYRCDRVTSVTWDSSDATSLTDAMEQQGWLVEGRADDELSAWCCADCMRGEKPPHWKGLSTPEGAAVYAVLSRETDEECERLLKDLRTILPEANISSSRHR